MIDRATPRSHHDLPSFLEHAERVDLPTSSPTYVGTHFEYTALHTLSRYGLSLSRVGGRDDQGIDLIGTWKLPPPFDERTLKVFLQCKVLVKRCGPNLIRELEGAFAGAPAAWKGRSTLGCLVASTLPTASLRGAMHRCKMPMMFLSIQKDSGIVRAWNWNWAAREAGLVGLEATTRFGTTRDLDGSELQESEVVLAHEREVILPHGQLLGMEGLDLVGPATQNDTS